jgi:hypothetical protein
MRQQLYHYLFEVSGVLAGYGAGGVYVFGQEEAE